MRIILSFLLLFLSQFNFSQDQNEAFYNWNKAQKLSDSVFIKAREFYKVYYKENIYVGQQSIELADNAATRFYMDYLQGDFYTSFLGYESYIKEILGKLVSDEKLLSHVHVYFNRDDEFNASIDVIGNLRVNLNIFCYMNTEAELAAIIAHELAHFYNKDGLEKRSFLINQFGGLKTISYLKTQESAADFLAINYLKNSPYSLKGMINMFKTIKRFEIKKELKNRDAFHFRIAHPDPGDRLKQVKILSKDSFQYNKKNFVVDSIKFMKLKTAAIAESFKVMASKGNFKDLIELSFTKHLYEPDNQDNLSILIESLRRYIDLNPGADTSQFIISFYKGTGADNSENYKYVRFDSTSILRYLNKGLLHLASNDISKLPKNEIIDSTVIEFRTNKEAYDYFVKRGKTINCKPCQLSEQNSGNVMSNSVFDIASYVTDKKNGVNYNGNVVIINLPTFYVWEYLRDYNVEKLTVLLKKIADGIKQQVGSEQVYFISDLPLKDQKNLRILNQIAGNVTDVSFYYKCIFGNAMNFGSGKLAIQENYSKKYLDIDWLKSNPEAYDFFKDYKVKSVYFVDFDYFTIDPGDYPAMTGTRKISRSWKIKKISAEQPSKLIYHHNISTTTKTLDDEISDCGKNVKMFIMNNM